METPSKPVAEEVKVWQSPGLNCGLVPLLARLMLALEFTVARVQFANFFTRGYS